jgi:S1-C subfamily serine protease
VPIDSARRSLTQLVTTGKVAYAFAGIRTVDVTPTLARDLGLAVSHGALVIEVEAGSAAARGGMRQGSGERVINGISVRPGGDVIVAIGARHVQTGEDVARIVGEELQPGQIVTFTVIRGGRRLNLALRMGTRKP